jgi:DNA mismatch repair protein MutS2
MQQHSYEVLEYNKLKIEVAKNAILEETEEKIIELSHIKDINKIRYQLDLTNDLAELIKFDGGIEINKIKDMQIYMKKINLIGAYLEAEDLYYVKENLKIFRRAKNKISGLKEKYKNLHKEFSGANTYKNLEEFMEKIVDDEKKVKDDASLDLANIRKEKASLGFSIRRKFDDIINNPSNEKMLQEKLVTVRDGRFVIPIKAEFKGQLKGIEHDRSSSGQTIYIEPLSIVSLNNKAREYEVKEREEIRKILLRMTDILRNNIDGLEEVYEALKVMDFINAKALFSIEYNCSVPKVIEKEYINLIKARHPFIDKNEVVPLDFGIGKNENILLITGPNTGGKTVALKTAGLLTLMTLSGIPITADEKTEIGFFNNVYADIGDEQSIEQSLSSFSAHLKNMKEILSSITKNSLILLDELGSGTDPIEGAAFAMAVIDYIKDKKSKAMITTHYSEVKAYAYNEENIGTASMEFDIETLSPTYKLLLGVPGESNALTIAKKLGIPDEIVEKAKKYISEEDKKVEKMITNIKEKSEEVEKSKLELENMKQNTEKLQEEYNEKMRLLEKEKEEIIKKAYEDAEKLVKNMQEKAKVLVKKIQSEEAKKEEAKATQRSLNMLMRSIEEEKTKKVEKKPKIKAKLEAKAGDKVFVKSLNKEAVVLKVNMKKQEVQIQAGILKLMVPFEDVKKVEEKKKSGYVRTHTLNKRNVKYEIDIRGKAIDEGITEIESYLDSAMLNSYNEVYVIHGKGTGKLRIGIQQYLKKSPYVKDYRDGNINEGGLGVTVVKLR